MDSAEKVITNPMLKGDELEQPLLSRANSYDSRSHLFCADPSCSGQKLGEKAEGLIMPE